MFSVAGWTLFHMAKRPGNRRQTGREPVVKSVFIPLARIRNTLRTENLRGSKRPQRCSRSEFASV
jgi:hypothetical protein